MAAATKRIVGLDGIFNKVDNFCWNIFFLFNDCIKLNSNSDPTDSQVYLYVFYQAGIISGALYQMNKLTSNLNMWDDLASGYR